MVGHLRTAPLHPQAHTRGGGAEKKGNLAGGGGVAFIFVAFVLTGSFFVIKLFPKSETLRPACPSRTSFDFITFVSSSLTRARQTRTRPPLPSAWRLLIYRSCVLLPYSCAANSPRPPPPLGGVTGGRSASLRVSSLSNLMLYIHGRGSWFDRDNLPRRARASFLPSLTPVGGSIGRAWCPCLVRPPRRSCTSFCLE